MAPQTDEDRAALQQRILTQLAPTPFACTGPLTALTNGTTNFVFRGILATSHSEGVRSIIIKHATDYAAVNKDFPLDVTRSLFEETMLDALNKFPQGKQTLLSNSQGSSLFTTKAPQLLWFDRATNTQVLEDFPDAIDLKATLLASAAQGTEEKHPLTKYAQLSHSIGVALGAWLRSFHSWTSERGPARSSLRQTVAGNEPMRKLKHQITYDALVRVVSQFPDALGDGLSILEEVQTAAAAEFDKKPPAESGEAKDEDNWGIIHGDFWSGNILLPGEDSLKLDTTTAQQLFVVDWEFVQYGHPAYDIGQLIGDLIERDHFKGARASLDVLAGFVSGYFPDGADDRIAFRIAIHVGVQIIGFFIRRAPTGPLPGTQEQAEQAIQLGTDFVVKGWTKDRAWFQSSVLAPLFK